MNFCSFSWVFCTKPSASKNSTVPFFVGGAAGRDGAGWDGGGWMRPGRRRVDALRRKPSVLPSRVPKTTVLNVSLEARTNEILCKPDRGTQRAVDYRLITETASALRSRLQINGPTHVCICLYMYTLFMQGMSGNSCRVKADLDLRTDLHARK